MIPEEYLEYEREAEARKRREAERETSDAELAVEGAEEEDDPFSIRVEELLNTSKKTLQERAAEKKRAMPDVTIGEVVETIEEMLPDEPQAPAEPEGEEISLEEALRAERQRSSRAAKEARRKSQSQPRNSDRSEKAKREDDIPTWFKCLIVAIVLVVAAIVVLLGPLMRIDHVEVNDLQNMSEAQVEEIAGNPVGQNLFLYRTVRAEEELSYYPYVQAVEIHRHFPHWLEITITEREPAGVLLNNGSYLQFSKDGVLLDNTETLTNQSLPLITGFSMDEIPSPGEAFKDNARFSDILKIVNACSDDLLSMIQEINIKDRNNILAYTSQGIEIRIGGVDNIETRMANLADIMDQVILSGIIEDPIEAIDIRYEKSPVVVLEGYDDIDLTQYLEEDEENDENSTAGGSQTGTSDTQAGNTTAQTDEEANSGQTTTTQTDNSQSNSAGNSETTSDTGV